MKVGDRVRSTEEWTERFGIPRVRGEVNRVAEHGPLNPKRTVLVRLDEPVGGFPQLWFDPDDLEADDD